MTPNTNLPSKLVERLLARLDFSALERELPAMDRYLPPDLRLKARSALADHYESQGKDVESILEYNRVRCEKIDDAETIFEFFRKIQHFIQVNRRGFTRSDILHLEELVGRLRKFYEVYPPKGGGTIVPGNEILVELASLASTVKKGDDGPASLQVHKLCFGLDEQMTHKEVMNRLAQVLLPGIKKAYEAEAAKTGTKTKKRGHGRSTRKSRQ